jgi:hypothetical protein
MSFRKKNNLRENVIPFKDFFSVDNPYCTWKSDLNFPVQENYLFDSVHIDINGPNPIVEITFFKNGNYYRDTTNILEDTALKLYFKELTSIITNKQGLHVGQVTHKYYDDGSGSSKIIF